MDKSIAVHAGTDSAPPRVESCGSGRFVLKCRAEMAWRARTELVDFLVESFGQTRVKELILDLGSVAYLNSAGIGAIFVLRNHVIGDGGAMAICNVKPAVGRLLTAVNLQALIPILDDLAAAHGFFDRSGGDDQ